MLYVYSSNVKEAKLADYQEWLKKNHARIEKEAPAGWTFQGVYLPVFGFGTHLSEIHWEVANYAAFDAAHADFDKGGGYRKLIEEWYDFLDLTSTDGRLLKHATDPRTLVSAP